MRKGWAPHPPKWLSLAPEVGPVDQQSSLMLLHARWLYFKRSKVCELGTNRSLWLAGWLGLGVLGHKVSVGRERAGLLFCRGLGGAMCTPCAQGWASASPETLQNRKLEKLEPRLSTKSEVILAVFFCCGKTYINLHMHDHMHVGFHLFRDICYEGFSYF